MCNNLKNSNGDNNIANLFEEDDEEGTCDNCGGELKAEKVTLEELENGKLYVMENVPAKVCQDCGEKWVPETVLKEFEKMMELTQPPKTAKKTRDQKGKKK